MLDLEHWLTFFESMYVKEGSMKKLGHFLKIPLAASLAFGCLSTSSVFGAEAPQSESQPISSNQVDPPNVEYTDSDNPFDHLKPEDNILPLEDGGFLIGSGEVEIFSIDDLNTPIETIDLDSNPNTVTKEKAYSLLVNKEKEAIVNPQQDIIVPSSDKVMGLKLGQQYVSQQFTGTGWVFAGWWFVAMEPDKYGSHLRWSTHVDSGRVTDIYHFHLLDNAGAAIYPGQYYWISFGTSIPQIYCTINPLKGTYYTVANINA